MNEHLFRDAGAEPLADVDRGRAVVGLLDAMSPTGSPVPELRDLASVLGRARVKIDSLMCRIAAEVERSGTGAGAASVLQDSGRLSGRDARRVAKVAGKLAEMPNTAERLAAGDITMDNASALVTAAEQCGTGVVDGDAGLLERAGKASSESFAREARRFAGAKSPDRGEALLERQRRARTASAFVDADTGMGRVFGAFDPISFNLIEQVVDGHTDALWRADGGRDGRPEEVRTCERRLGRHLLLARGHAPRGPGPRRPSRLQGGLQAPEEGRPRSGDGRPQVRRHRSRRTGRRPGPLLIPGPEGRSAVSRRAAALVAKAERSDKQDAAPQSVRLRTGRFWGP